VGLIEVGKVRITTTGRDALGGKLSVKSTDGLTRIKSGCSLLPCGWSLAFSTWTPLSGALVLALTRSPPEQADGGGPDLALLSESLQCITSAVVFLVRGSYWWDA
jgi:hypothetical protein